MPHIAFTASAPLLPSVLRSPGPLSQSSYAGLATGSTTQLRPSRRRLDCPDQHNAPGRRSATPVAVLEEAPAVTKAPPQPKGDDLWSPSSWRAFPAKQQPQYPDAAHLNAVEQTISKLPPLVAPGELSSLKRQLGNVALGHGFILQGGDCAEDLNETASGVKDTMRSLFKMAVVLMWGAQQPVIKIGRIAGQYGKPRSNDMETRDGMTLPVYRGEVGFFFLIYFQISVSPLFR